MTALLQLEKHLIENLIDVLSPEQTVNLRRANKREKLWLCREYLNCKVLPPSFLEYINNPLRSFSTYVFLVCKSDGAGSSWPDKIYLEPASISRTTGA